MKKRTKAIAAAAVALAAGGTGVAIASGASSQPKPPAERSEAPEVERGETERAIPPGDDKSRAEAAALKHVGEGRVTETEIEDEESYYEVEVTKDDGSQVDVQLDENFNVVGTESDGAGEDG